MESAPLVRLGLQTDVLRLQRRAARSRYQKRADEIRRSARAHWNGPRYTGQQRPRAARIVVGGLRGRRGSLGAAKRQEAARRAATIRPRLLAATVRGSFQRAGCQSRPRRPQGNPRRAQADRQHGNKQNAGSRSFRFHGHRIIRNGQAESLVNGKKSAGKPHEPDWRPPLAAGVRLTFYPEFAAPSARTCSRSGR